MPAENLKPALEEALRRHEIGDNDNLPYEISFAGKGNSGASFGFMQGDLAAGQPEAQRTFRDALVAAQVPKTKIESIASALFGKPHKTNPLNSEDTKLVNDALKASKALVDKMDDTIAGKVFTDVDKVTAAATSAHRTIEPKVLLYVANWINMTGPPSKLLTWVAGGDVGGGIPKAGNVIDEAAIQAYLRAQKYYKENSENWPHMVNSVAKGAALLP